MSKILSILQFNKNCLIECRNSLKLFNCINFSFIIFSTLTFSCVLFQTITLCPLFSRFLTIPLPIIPRPRNPNFKSEACIFLSFKVWEIFSTSKGGVTWNSHDFFNKILLCLLSFWLKRKNILLLLLLKHYKALSTFIKFSFA